MNGIFSRCFPVHLILQRVSPRKRPTTLLRNYMTVSMSTHPKKTYGGRHSGAMESNHLGIPNKVIKEGSRWMAERGKMETYYSSDLPSAFALGMARFQDKPYYLSRNGVDPSVELQQMVFPWIEEAYGKDNDEWRKECTAEMVDTNIVPPISDGPSSTLAKALAESGESSKSAMMMAYQDRDIAKAGFLRLIVRCRRIILQDAAYRLHYKQKSLILNHEIFQSSWFTTFQQELGDFVDKPTPNTLQLAREAMPEIVGKLQSMSARLHQQEHSLQTFIRDHQQQLQVEIKQKEQALKEQKEYYENLLAQQQQSFNQRFPQHLQHPQYYHQHQQHQQQHYQQPHSQQHSLAPFIQLRGLIDSIIEQQHPHFFIPGPLTTTSFQGPQNLPHLSQPQVPAPHPPHRRLPHFPPGRTHKTAHPSFEIHSSLSLYHSVCPSPG